MTHVYIAIVVAAVPYIAVAVRARTIDHNKAHQLHDSLQDWAEKALEK